MISALIRSVHRMRSSSRSPLATSSRCMKMPPTPNVTLSAILRDADPEGLGAFSAANGLVRYRDLLAGRSIDASTDLRDSSILLAVPDQLSAALALIELDGLARRIVLCPPDV